MKRNTSVHDRQDRNKFVPPLSHTIFFKRMIDTAEYYGNEADVGAAVKSCGVPREDIFVVTKLWDHGYDTCMRHFSESFKKLDIGCVER